MLSGCNGPPPNTWGDAPDFTLPTIEGDNFTLSDHLGKVILLDFMATWCGPCKIQMPELEYVREQKGDDLVIVSIDIEKWETPEMIRGTFGDYVDQWTFVSDTNEENVAQVYEVIGIPKLVIIDTKGNIYYDESGLTSRYTLLELIEEASKE